MREKRQETYLMLGVKMTPDGLSSYTGSSPRAWLPCIVSEVRPRGGLEEGLQNRGYQYEVKAELFKTTAFKPY